MRRKLTVSLTIAVVSGITSDVNKRSSVCSDGICQTKREIGYTRLSIKKKENERNRSSIIELMHQSIPAVPMPPPPRANPRALAFFFEKMGKFPGVGTHKPSKWPGVGTKKEGKCPAPGIVAFQHFCGFLLISE